MLFTAYVFSSLSIQYGLSLRIQTLLQIAVDSNRALYNDIWGETNAQIWNHLLLLPYLLYLSTAETVIVVCNSEFS